MQRIREKTNEKSVLRKHVYKERLVEINIIYRSLLNVCDQLIGLNWGYNHHVQNSVCIAYLSKKI